MSESYCSLFGLLLLTALRCCVMGHGGLPQREFVRTKARLKLHQQESLGE